jgi:hypothetical protein
MLHSAQATTPEDDDTQAPGPIAKRQQRAWIEEWAKTNSDQTIRAAQEAMKERFGRSMCAQTISAVLKTARRKADPAFAPKAHLALAEAPEPSFLQQLVAMVKASGIRKIEVRQDGTVSIEVSVD